MNDGLVELFRYNAWANRVLFEACRSLSDSELDSQVAGTSGSVRELLIHIVGGQQTQVLRTKGRQHEGELNRSSEWPGIETLIELVEKTGEELITIAQQLQGDEEVDLPYLGKSYRFPKRFFLAHAIAHGIEHRTEVKVALAHIGVETPDLDGWPYAEAAGYGREVDLT
jgi:uncharacterized damage-inducible protein DinB